MLKDGRIIDGRNRWMACQKAGVEPLIDVINPDGEEVTDERLFALATSCNSMRRDLTTSERAVASAVAWKRLFPEETRGGDVKAKGKKLPFEDFAKDNFKIGKDYAGRALATPITHQSFGGAGRVRCKADHWGLCCVNLFSVNTLFG